MIYSAVFLIIALYLVVAYYQRRHTRRITQQLLEATQTIDELRGRLEQTMEASKEAEAAKTALAALAAQVVESEAETKAETTPQDDITEVIMNFLQENACGPERSEDEEGKTVIDFTYQGGNFCFEGHMGVWRLLMPWVETIPITMADEIRLAINAAARTMSRAWGGKLIFHFLDPAEVDEDSADVEADQVIFGFTIMHDFALDPNIHDLKQLIKMIVENCFILRQIYIFEKNSARSWHDYLSDIDFTPGSSAALIKKCQLN